MANKEQVAILKQGPLTWNKWREANPHIAIDLSRARVAFSAGQLRGANLAGANLEQNSVMGSPASPLLLAGANLRRSNLAYSDLGNPLWNPNLQPGSSPIRTASFQNADFSESLLDCTSLQNADLSGANFSNTILFRTNFHGADLSGANFSDAYLNDIVLTRGDLTGAIGLETCRHAGPSSLDIQTLRKSGKLPETFLRGCGLPEKLIEYLPSIINTAKEYYSCFISYSHKDESFARRLHDQLQHRGIRCWLDEHQILPGDDPYDEIDKGIRVWDKVLLCCSESSLSSWWVDKEIDLVFSKERGFMRNRGDKKLLLIPLNLDDFLYSEKCENGKKALIQGRSPANFVGWEDGNAKFERALELVILALRADAAAKQRPPDPLL